MRDNRPRCASERWSASLVSNKVTGQRDDLSFLENVAWGRARKGLCSNPAQRDCQTESISTKYSRRCAESSSPSCCRGRPFSGESVRSNKSLTDWPTFWVKKSLAKGFCSWWVNVRALDPGASREPAASY